MSGEESVGTESVSLGSWSSLIMRFSLVSNSTRFLKKNNPVIMSLVSNHDILNGYFDTAISQYLIFNLTPPHFRGKLLWFLTLVLQLQSQVTLQIKI